MKLKKVLMTKTQKKFKHKIIILMSKKMKKILMKKMNQMKIIK